MVGWLPCYLLCGCVHTPLDTSCVFGFDVFGMKGKLVSNDALRQLMIVEVLMLITPQAFEGSTYLH